MRTEKSPPRMACKTCSRLYPNEVAPLLLLVEPCSRSVSSEPVAGDSIVSAIPCIAVPPAMIKAQRQAARMLATRSDELHGPGCFPASSSRRGAPPALIRTKTRQTGESSEASAEFSLFLRTTSHFVHECAGLAACTSSGLH